MKVKKGVENLIDCKPEEHNFELGLRDSDVKKVNTLYECQGWPQFGAESKPKFRSEANAKCKNIDIFCGAWSKEGKCDLDPYKNYLQKFCKQSCGKC